MTSHGEYRPLEWTDDKVARFWRWQSRFPQTYFTYQFGACIAAHLKRPLAGRRTVLDYGCGPGFLIPHLVALGAEVTAADVSKDAVKAAGESFKPLSGFRGAMTVDELIAAGTPFDAAVSMEVVEHLSDEHLEIFFRNLGRLLRPDGIAVITTPNEENMDLSMVYCPDSDRIFHRWQHVRQWSGKTLGDAVAARGFRVERVYTTDFSKRPSRDVLGAAKRLAKRALGRPEKRPHLVCIARRGV